MRLKKSNKRWRKCQRLGALFSSLLCCVLLVVPAFASNNASTEQWFVKSKVQMTAESGQTGFYYQITPYESYNAEPTYVINSFAPNVGFRFNSVYNTSSGSWVTGEGKCVYALNYPVWWRSSLPFGPYAYIGIELVDAWANLSQSSNLPQSYSTSLDSVRLYVFDKSNALEFSYTDTYENQYVSGGYTVNSGALTITSASSNCYVVLATKGTELDNSLVSGSTFASYVLLSSGEESTVRVDSTWKSSLSPSPNYSQADSGESVPTQPGIAFFPVSLSDFDLTDLVLAVAPSSDDESSKCYIGARVRLSFYIDANKLPPGLEVGDTFPANLDSFEDLQQELLELYPDVDSWMEDTQDAFDSATDDALNQTLDTELTDTFFNVLDPILSNFSFLSYFLILYCAFIVACILISKARS